MKQGDFPKKGKAIVTGASSGIGSVYADRLAKRGYDLIVVARDTKKLDALAARLQSETGRTVEVVTADLSEKSNLVRVEQMLESDSAISMIVNNAAYSDSVSFVDATGDEVENMITLNITALTRLSNAAARSFAKKKAGTIINISSGVVMMPDQFNAVYGASKAFVLNFTRNIAEQLKPHGISVQVVLPGAVLTEGFQRVTTDGSQIPKEAIMSPQDLVDASLKGLDQGEVVTIPPLADLNAWEVMEQARMDIVPKLFNGKIAPRYK